MRRASRVLPAALAIALAASAASAAGGDDATTDARLEYNAPSSCPSDGSFVAQVSARTARLRRVAEGGSRVFVVDVSPLESGFRGQLTSIGPTGDRASREVFGDSCAEVVGALGLVLALAVDPAATTAPLAPAPVFVAMPAPAEPPPPSPEPSPPPPDTAPGAVARETVPARSGAARPLFGAGGGVASTGGIGPAPMVGGALFVEAGFGERGLFRPSARLGVQRASTGTIDVPGGAARLTWTVGTLDACPVRWARSNLALTPCARVDAGVIAGSGAKIAHPQDDSRLWLAAGAVARGEWTFVSPLFVDVEAGAFVPITRPRFHFDAPDVTIHEPASVGGGVAAHVGGRFP